jgi:hypothetical protein
MGMHVTPGSVSSAFFCARAIRIRSRVMPILKGRPAHNRIRMYDSVIRLKQESW